ncbi:MAG: FAD-binding protein [Chloroflexota bacterium]
MTTEPVRVTATRSKRRKAAAAVAAVLLASTGVLTGQKASEMAADPRGEKDCPPVSVAAQGGAGAETSSPPVIGAGSAVATAGVPPAASLTGAPAQLPWKQKGGALNDASCLNRTSVYGVVQVTTPDDIKRALDFARSSGLKVSIAGVRHSMGGHAFARNAVVLDMTRFNAIVLDEGRKVVTVQSGATWHDIQNVLHPRLAVKSMQSTDIFTVGGSISVNAHGMDHQAGSVRSSIRSLRVMLPDGSVQRASPTENAELFDLVVGGYGLFGIVLDADLDVVNNEVYTAEQQLIDYRAFPELFATRLSQDRDLGLFYGHLSTSSSSLLEEMILYQYRRAGPPRDDLPPLGEVSSIKLRRLLLNFSKLGELPMRLKWWAEKNVEPRLETCTVPRTQAMGQGEACFVSRNDPMHDSVKYLKNDLQRDTDILHEYFIPRDRFVPFVDGLREIVRRNGTILLNASVRIVHREENVLTYAPNDAFAVVLYINQATTAEANQAMAQTTRELIDLSLAQGGTFFLPYQLYYTPEQLQRAYPQLGAFFEAKRRYDPGLLLTNTFYERYGPRP